MEQIIMPYWKYKGKTLDEIMKFDPHYLQFIKLHTGCDGYIKSWIWDHWGEIQERIRIKEGR